MAATRTTARRGTQSTPNAIITREASVLPVDSFGCGA
jgi:hypothetical protein